MEMYALYRRRHCRLCRRHKLFTFVSSFQEPLSPTHTLAFKFVAMKTFKEDNKLERVNKGCGSLKILKNQIICDIKTSSSYYR